MNIGSCLALNLSYSGCCEWSLSPPCSINGCFCDERCHKLRDCCSDITDISCHLSFPKPTSTDTLSIINPSLSDSIVTPTPTVSSGILNTINEMKPFVDEYIYIYRFMFST